MTLCQVNNTVAEGVQLARAGNIDDAGEEFVEIYKKGVYPTQNTYGFWGVLVRYASAKGDAPVLEASITHLKEIFGPKNERALKWLATYEAKLAELKGAQK